MLKRSSNASRKTWYEATCQAQEDLRARKWLLSDKIETLPLGEGVGRARVEVCLLGPQAEEAPVPVDLDRAHRRRLQAERHQLQPVHQRTEEGRHRAGPEDSGGPGGEGRGWVYLAVRASESRARSSCRSVRPFDPETSWIHAMGGRRAARCVRSSCQSSVVSCQYSRSFDSVAAATSLRMTLGDGLGDHNEGLSGSACTPFPNSK